MQKAIGFDLGETLIHYPGIPLSWQSLYEPALKEVADKCNYATDDKAILAGCAILSTYNTRLNPRDEEVCSDMIMAEILKVWGVSPNNYLEIASETFFEFFQQTAEVFDDVIPALRFLRGKGYKIGILTDVAYGMGKKFGERDMASFAQYVDVVLTSTEVGFRKPRPEGYLKLARRLGADPSQMIYIGNEPKDILGANKSGMISIFLDRDESAITYGEKLKITSLLELRNQSLLNIV